MSEGGGEDQVGSLSWDKVQEWAFPKAESPGKGEPTKRKRKPRSTGERISTARVLKRKSSCDGEEGKLVTEGPKCGESDQELHIWTERERRKKMRDMFANLHGLLPQLPSKADKSTVIDEAVSYIKELERTLQKLLRQKMERTHGGSAAGEPSPAAGSSADTRESFMADQCRPSWPLGMISSPTPIAVPRVPACFQTWTTPNVVLSVAGGEAQIGICCRKKMGLLSVVFYVLQKHKIQVVSASFLSDYFRSMCMIQAHASGMSDQFLETLMIEDTYKSAVGEINFFLSS
ncbi:Transcription factor bHLH95 [Apostasia shenzhenica]|uniref:Transcription factor bHLH95 n=1 Tax=Apostasia shenzhenica TaxID=1088818 RepID=A0A2I0B142_9ASPA|nr:Transcription factor bHLH95 [Apostasia shenzhenica]